MQQTPKIRMGRMIVRLAILTTAALISQPSAWAVTKQWNVASGDWNEGNNWSPTGVAGSEDNAYINNGGLLNVTDAQEITVFNVGFTTAALNNRMMIDSTGFLTATGISTIGYSAATIGTVEVAGTLTISNRLQLGLAGDGTLSILSGGHVNNTAGLTMGSASTSTGTLTIADGGSMSGTTVNIGNTAGATATATVSGMWTNSDALSVGVNGTGTLNVNSGGVVTSVGATNLGSQTGSSGEALVRGSLSNDNNFRIGRQGSGVLTIGQGGTVNVKEGTEITYLAFSGGAASGVLNIGGIVDGSTPGAAEGAGILNSTEVRGHASSGTSTINFNHTDADYHFTKTGASGGSNILISGATTKVNVYSGTTTFGGANTYGNGTYVHGGRLILTNASAAGAGAVTLSGGTLEVDVNSGAGAVNKTMVFTGSDATYQLHRANGTGYSAYSASSNIAGGTQTAVSFLAGTANGATTLTTSFDITSAAINDAIRLSDVFSLTGTGSDLFVLQLKIDSLTADEFIGWLDGDSWVNAVTGNSGNNATEIQQGFAGSFASFQGIYGSGLSGYVGAYGVDVGNGAVWAVLNHNSDFAVIPEPSALLLAGLGLGLLLFGFRRRGTRALS